MQGLRLGPAVFKFTPKVDCVVIEVREGASAGSGCWARATVPSPLSRSTASTSPSPRASATRPSASPLSRRPSRARRRPRRTPLRRRPSSWRPSSPRRGHQRSRPSACAQRPPPSPSPRRLPRRTASWTPFFVAGAAALRPQRRALGLLQARPACTVARRRSPRLSLQAASAAGPRLAQGGPPRGSRRSRAGSPRLLRQRWPRRRRQRTRRRRLRRMRRAAAAPRRRPCPSRLRRLLLRQRRPGSCASTALRCARRSSRRCCARRRAPSSGPEPPLLPGVRLRRPRTPSRPTSLRLRWQREVLWVASAMTASPWRPSCPSRLAALRCAAGRACRASCCRDAAREGRARATCT